VVRLAVKLLAQRSKAPAKGLTCGKALLQHSLPYRHTGSRLKSQASNFPCEPIGQEKSSRLPKPTGSEGVTHIVVRADEHGDLTALENIEDEGIRRRNARLRYDVGDCQPLGPAMEDRLDIGVLGVYLVKSKNSARVVTDANAIAS
jgi:hypothetical protein